MSKISDAGNAVVDGAKTVGNKIAEGACQATDWVKEKTGMTTVKERMDVIASCGKKIGVVDHIEGGAIKLTRNDSPDGQHHFIPMDWVKSVDKEVHLKKNSMETESQWKSDASSCGCGA